MPLKKNTFWLLAAFAAFFFCARPQPMSDDLLMQIKNVGLRKDVLIRRYQMTTEYHQKTNFTAADVQSYIEKNMAPDYLLIQHAYDLGMHKQPVMQNKIRDYQIGLLAEEHPVKYKELNISKSDLKAFYEKKSFKYDVELIVANSYAMADSLYRCLNRGDRFKFDAQETEMIHYPQIKLLREITYGEMLHPELAPFIAELKEGEACRPVYTSPTWSLIRVNRKNNNTALRPFTEVEQELVMQASQIYKYTSLKNFIDDLQKKYPVAIAQSFFPMLRSANVRFEGSSYIDKNKLSGSVLQDAIIKVGDEVITVEHFIANLNKANQFLKLTELTDQDIDRFADDFKIQLLLYLDAKEQGVANQPLVMDQLVNKEYRLILPEYLKQEIVEKIKITDSDALAYYQSHREKWTGEFKNVAPRIKNDLRNARIKERQAELVKELQKKYTVRYNPAALTLAAEQLAKSKSQPAVSKN